MINAIRRTKKKLKLTLENGETADILIKDINNNACLKDLIDDELQNQLPYLNFRNLKLYSSGKRYDEDTNVNQLPNEMMALSCPDPPQWCIPGPGGHLPLQALHPYTVLRPIPLIVGDDGLKERTLSPGCRIMVDEVSSDHLKIKTMHYDKRNIEGLVAIQPNPIFSLPDMPLTLREGDQYSILLSNFEMMSGNMSKLVHLLAEGDVVKMVIDSDFIHRVFPADTLLVVQLETETQTLSGTIKILRNHQCSIRPITNAQNVKIGEFHFLSSRPVKTFEDFSYVIKNDPIVLSASVTNLGISVLTLEGGLKLLDKKTELVNVRQAFALQVILAKRLHPNIHIKCHNMAVSAEMISLRSRWLAGIQSSLGMIHTKSNIKTFSEYAPIVGDSFACKKLVDRVLMTPLSIVAAVL